MLCYVCLGCYSSGALRENEGAVADVENRLYYNIDYHCYFKTSVSCTNTSCRPNSLVHPPGSFHGIFFVYVHVALGVELDVVVKPLREVRGGAVLARYQNFHLVMDARIQPGVMSGATTSTTQVAWRIEESEEKKCRILVVKV